MGFAVWLQQRLVSNQDALEALLSRQPPAPDPETSPAAAEAFLRTLFDQGSFPAPALGHSGLNKLAQRWEARFYADLLGHSGKRQPWRALADRLSLEPAPARSWASWPTQPLPWIGEPETPALRLPFRKVHGHVSSDGLPVLSMSHLLGMAEGRTHPVTALRAPSVDLYVQTRHHRVQVVYHPEARGSCVIEGQITDAFGTPASNAHVLALRLEGEYWATGTVDGNGRYRLTDLPPGTYSLEITVGYQFGRIQAVHETGVYVATETVVDRVFLPPASASLHLSVAPSTTPRELVLSGDALWVAWTGPEGTLPGDHPPPGFDLTVLDSDETFVWQSGKLRDASGTARPAMKAALTETQPVWKVAWNAHHPIDAGQK
ncbi:MAG TPA: carboxypeptidase-like regulatory domain-containing protein, partial [Candidatus Ozemobacteraceae bacterium]|nr:carboxypeptidase-like regulatory domain-containing protein [Candidatus Ozemobacteraceae bacterium]